MKPDPEIGAKARRGAFWSVASQGAGAALSLLTFALLGRYVGPKEYGDYILATLLISCVQWLALNAYKEPLIQAPRLEGDVADSAFWFCSLLGAALGALCLMVAFVTWRYWQAGPVAACVGVLSLKVLADTVASVPAALRARELDFPTLARASISGSVLASLLAIGLLLAGFGIVGVAAGQAVGAALTPILLITWSPWRPRWHMARADLAIYRRYSPHVVVWQAVELLNNAFDRFFVAARLSVQTLGTYGFARRLNDVAIDVLVGAAANVSLPAFSAIQHDRGRLQGSFLRAIRLVTFLVLPVIATLFATAHDLIAVVFGDKWLSAVPVYRCFLLLGVIQTVGILQAALIRSLGEARQWSHYMLVQTAANVLVVCLSIGQGIFVLALAIVVRSYAIWGWAVWKTCRLVDMPVSTYLMTLARTAVLAGFAGLCGWLAAAEAAGLPSLLRLALAGAVAAAVYLTSAWWLLRASFDEFRKLFQRS